MTKKTSNPAAVAKKKLIVRIAAAQKQVDAAKKSAKAAKAVFKLARQKFKDARSATKKLRKAVKTLKTERAALAVKKLPRKPAAPKPAVKRFDPVAAPVIAPAPFEAPPVTNDIPPVDPTT